MIYLEEKKTLFNQQQPESLIPPNPHGVCSLQHFHHPNPKPKDPPFEPEGNSSIILC